VNEFLLAATVMLAGFVPVGIVCLRAGPIDALAALELAGALATTILLCLSEGFGRSFYFDVPVVCAALTWVSGLVFARFLGRHI
jgi:multisubunit Na+/H+ antiporter MnhF subunit